MKNNETTLRFWLRTDKKLISGKAPIQLIISMHGQRKYQNTGLKVFAENWDENEQKAIYLDKKTAKQLLPTVPFIDLPTSKDIEIINNDLLNFKHEIRKIENNFSYQKIVFTAEMVATELIKAVKPKTKKEADKNELFEFMDKYIQDNSSTRVKGSLTVYKSVRNHLFNYCVLHKCKVTFQSIDYAFFHSFQKYLIEVAKLNSTTIAKQLSTIKTFLNYAKKYNYDVSDKYREFKIRKEPLEVIALTKDEFELLYNYDFSDNKAHERIRDVFAFSCVTALRFSDIKQLSKEHIIGNDIVINVTKTKEQQHIIPLNSYSTEILKKYKHLSKCLPTISNQKSNEHLKAICKICGINKLTEKVRYVGAERKVVLKPKYEFITMHVGRKTFCTLSLEKGMRAEVVMSISGHKDPVSFKRYVNITNTIKTESMIGAWG